MSTITPPPTTEQFNPLEEKVNEKSYANGDTSAFTEQDIKNDLAEPTFRPPPMEANEIPGMEPEKEKKPEVKKPPKQFNPGIEDLPEGEKTDRARQMAIGIIDVYEKLNNMANDWIKIPEKKIHKLHAAGEIDINMSVPFDLDQEITLGAFVKDYNNQCNDVCTVDEEFRKDIIPPLTRVLAKHGHGLSDEQQIVFIAGKHLATNSFKCWQMISTQKSIIDFAKEQLAQRNSRPARPAGMHSVPPEPQQPVYEAPPQQTDQQQAPIVNINDLPLQERVLLQHQQNISAGISSSNLTTDNNTGMPIYGNEKKLTAINKIESKNLRDQENRRKNTNRIQAAKKATIQKDVPVPGKKRGPKIGSKRKPKN